MKKRSILLCLLPFIWASTGCLPSEYSRNHRYADQNHRNSNDGYNQAPNDQYNYKRAPKRPRVSRRAVRKYRSYIRRCNKNIRFCKKRVHRLRKAIRQVRRSMYYQGDPRSFDRARSRMYHYYRHLQKYNRCVSKYRHRQRWARSYFQRRYGVDPGFRQRRRFAKRRRQHRQPYASRRWSQPPLGTAHRRHNHRHRPYHPVKPKVIPIPKPALPVQPNIQKRHQSPLQARRQNNGMAPKSNPTPAPVAPSPLNLPQTAQVQQWKSYCAREKQKYPFQQKLKFLHRKTSLQGKHFWDSKAFTHTAVAAIQTLYSANGRYVVLGADGRYSQAHCEDRTFHVWDTKQNRERKLRPPVTAYLLKNTHLVPWFQGKKNSQVEETLLHYDPQRGQAGLMIKAAFPAMKGRSRYLYLVWDLRSNQITYSWTLGSPGCHGAYRPVGVSPDGTTLYYTRNDLRILVKCSASRAMARLGGHRYAHKLISLDLSSGARRTVARIASSKKRLHTILPNRDFSRIAVIEYTEMKTKHAKVYVINTRSKTVRTFPAPLTPYGFAFTKDQQSLLMYSSKQGQLIRLSLQNGKETSYRTHRLGHAMGLSPDGRYLYIVFHSGIEVRELPSMKRLIFLKHRIMMGKVKFIHVDGSSVSGGTLFVKNGEKLYVQKLNFLGKSKKLSSKKTTILPRKITPQRKEPNTPNHQPKRIAPPKKNPSPAKQPRSSGFKYINY